MTWQQLTGNSIAIDACYLRALKSNNLIHVTKRSSASIALVAISIFGRASGFAQTNSNARIVGLWEEKGDTVHAISLRKADGTYRRKVLQKYDYARPAITYEERGHWMVRDEHYLFTPDYISTPLWKKDVGKQRNLRILTRGPTLLRYLSSDGAVVEERRIGKASDDAFERIRLENHLRKQTR